ncbi:MAG: 1,6-anhydro-N-acetylmuramyl-L-alanine amidase AmpD [Gammaproteobacteria bacterium]
MNKECGDLWRGGRLLAAAHHNSPHFHRRGDDVALSLLVVHSIKLGEYGGGDIAKLFCGALDCASRPEYETLKGLRVSAHFVIGRGGEVLQFVSADDCAWHAGESQWRGRKQCNDFSIGVELEGAEDDVFEECQYSALVNLSRALMKRSGEMMIAGHRHIAPERKTDPGEGFDWRRLFDTIGWQYDGRI